MKSVTSTPTAVAALRKTACVAMVVCTSLFSPAGYAQSEKDEGKPLTVAELKTIYLDCNARAMRGSVTGGEAAVCSVVYEELKKRAFDGDFEKFLAWSRTQTRVNSAAR